MSVEAGSASFTPERKVPRFYCFGNTCESSSSPAVAIASIPAAGCVASHQRMVVFPRRSEYDTCTADSKADRQVDCVGMTLATVPTGGDKHERLSKQRTAWSRPSIWCPCTGAHQSSRRSRITASTSRAPWHEHQALTASDPRRMRNATLPVGILPFLVSIFSQGVAASLKSVRVAVSCRVSSNKSHRGN